MSEMKIVNKEKGIKRQAAGTRFSVAADTELNKPPLALEIPSGLDELHTRLNALHQTVGELLRRLQPVSRETTAFQDALATEAAPAATAVGVSLNHALARVNDDVDLLHDQIARLEI